MLRKNADRNEYDYYRTPQATIAEFFAAFRVLEPKFNFKQATILDPCAGGDTKNEMAYPKMLRQLGCKEIITVDIRRDSRASIKKDYLRWYCAKIVDGIFSNPPFNLALEFILKSLRDVRKGGFVVMLLRLSFVASVKRRPFWRNNMPKWIIIHSKRPSFTEGNTDASDYAHFIWQKGSKPAFSHMIII